MDGVEEHGEVAAVAEVGRPVKKRVWARVKRLPPVAKLLWQNRKVEIALAASLLSLARQAYQVATGR